MIFVYLFATVGAIVLMSLGFAWALMVESWRDAVGALLMFMAGAGLAWLVLMA